MGDVERHPADPATDDDRVVVRVATRIAGVPQAAWDACAAGGGELQKDSVRPANPFVSHAFLKAIEDSGSAARETGWLPQHLLYEDGDGRLLACM
ncbi:MAG: peptidogalycan biosysnthesis protein, partial [Methyloceanibacter sp.]